MSFFAGLAQGFERGLPLGQAYEEARERKRMRSVFDQYGPGLVSGDPKAISALAQIDPGMAQGYQQNAFQLAEAQSRKQSEAIGQALGYFMDADTPQAWQERAAMAAKNGLFERLGVDPRQFTFENKRGLEAQVVGYLQAQRAPYELEAIKLGIESGRQEIAQGATALRDEASRRIGVSARAPQRGTYGDNVAQAYEYLIQKGETPTVAAALVGNLVQESGPGLNTEAVGDGGAAYGAAQWNGPRKRAYLAYAQDRGADPADLRTQLDFLLHEGQTTERAAFEAIRAAPDLDSATRIASERFWRPGDPRLENRTRYARDVASMFSERDANAEQARDDLGRTNPELAPYAPQGAISREQAERMRPQAALPEDARERLQAAAALGYDVEDPRFREYVLTGKLPADDDESAERRALLSEVGMDVSSDAGRHYLLTGKLPQGRALRIGPDGSVELIEGDGKLTSSNTTATQVKLQEARRSLRELSAIGDEIADEYLTYEGRARSAIGGVLDRANSSALNVAVEGAASQLGIELDAEQLTEFNAARNAAVARVQRLFQDYKVATTGAAAGETEMADLRKAFLSPDLGPKEFKQRFAQLVETLEADLATAERDLSQGLSGEQLEAPRRRAFEPAQPSSALRDDSFQFPEPESAARSSAAPDDRPVDRRPKVETSSGPVPLDAVDLYKRLIASGMSRAQALEEVRMREYGDGRN